MTNCSHSKDKKLEKSSTLDGTISQLPPHENAWKVEPQAESRAWGSVLGR